MLEVLVLSVLSPNIAARARYKGRAALPFIFLLLACWVWGELLGGLAAVAFAIMLGYEPDWFLAYATTWVGAIAGATVAFKKVNALPPRRRAIVSIDNTRDDRRDRDHGWGPY